MRIWFGPLSVLLCVNACLFAAYGGGAGTRKDPYLIGHADHIVLLANSPTDWSRHFVQTADIDLSGIVFRGYVVGTFTGRYDGRKHVVAGLTMSKPVHAASMAGFFGTLAEGSVVQNMVFEDASVLVTEGSDTVGIVAGYNLGTIYACQVQGTVTCTGKGTKIGGLVGQNEGWEGVRRCHADVVVTSGTDSVQVGGIAGYNRGLLLFCSSLGAVSGGSKSAAVGGLVGSVGGVEGWVVECFSSASVEGGSCVGGLAGIRFSSTIYGISDCYSSGSVTGVAEVGGLVGRCSGSVGRSYTVSEVGGQEAVGRFAGSGGQYYGCVYNLDVSPSLPAVGLYPPTDSGLYGRSSAAMRDLQTYVELDWDFFDLWEIDGTSYPTLRRVPGYEWFYNPGDGSGERPYQIGSVDQLFNIEGILDAVNKSFVLTCDLDFDPAVIGGSPCRNSLFFSTGAQYPSPYEVPLTFRFDGNGHALRNLTIDVHSPTMAGAVFGMIPEGAVVENLRVERCVVRGHELVGGLAAVNYGSVWNCTFSGEVYGGDDCRYIGGLVAQNGTMSPTCSGGPIRHCMVQVTLGAGQNAGYAGGVAGYNFQGVIDGCISEPNIVMPSAYTAGSIAGMNEGGWIDNCIGRGNVSGARIAGGLAGRNMNGLVRKCYSLATVDGTEQAGALVGQQYGGALRRSFWSAEACILEAIGQHESGDMVEVQALDWDGLTSRETYTDALWDFVGEETNGRADIWRLCVEGTGPPRLAWEFGGDLACPDGVGVEDLMYLAGRWLEAGLTPGASADRNGDGAVDLQEYGLVAGRWLCR